MKIELSKHAISLLKDGKFKKAIVQFIIDNDLWHHRGYFKPGDKVRYNWKARVYLSLTNEDNSTFTVDEILYRDKSGVSFQEGSGCDPFWLRQAKKHEL
ncbi:hypothetical protein AB6805_30410 [Chitinophaga sp. RCC_12]|uniref:hypothetical protein n=1 Tax=Chitinophaga sp. RCC_12 TaxID=3239226 RepID=UPI003525E67B